MTDGDAGERPDAPGERPDVAGEQFASAEAYYAEHRPGYGAAAIEHVRERFDLDGTGRVLDLGCGAGQLAVPLAAHAGEVVGMDPNGAMLREARRRAAATGREAGRESVAWVRGSDAELDGLAGPFRLATMGRSFHWMDQERTLDRLRELLEPGGGVAIFGDTEWLTDGEADWQAAVYELAAGYLDDLPPRTAGEEVDYETPWDELLADRGFEDVERATFDVEREWPVDGVVGYVFSLSFCSPDTFGDDRAAFERELREHLRERGGGPFRGRAEVSVTSGRR